MLDIQKELISYEYQETQLEAFCAHPQKDKNNTTILICHAWGGRDKFVEDVACKLATLGYTAIALDTYGKGILAESTEEKSALIQPLLNDRAMLQGRLKSGFDMVQNLNYVDKTKISAMGYCFGGLCVLDMVRMGLALQVVISVHGLFTKPDNLKDYKIRAKILALHGHLDPMVDRAAVSDFMQEMDSCDADWQINTFGKALHAFTNPQAHDYELGTVFNEDIAKRAWNDILHFLAAYAM